MAAAGPPPSRATAVAVHPQLKDDDDVLRPGGLGLVRLPKLLDELALVHADSRCQAREAPAQQLTPDSAVLRQAAPALGDSRRAAQRLLAQLTQTALQVVVRKLGRAGWFNQDESAGFHHSIRECLASARALFAISNRTCRGDIADTLQRYISALMINPFLHAHPVTSSGDQQKTPPEAEAT